eukprot:jgi/Mesen1/7717/ME000406S06937
MTGRERILCTTELVEFDWKLKYVLSGSTLSSINQSVLRLELSYAHDEAAPGSVPAQAEAGDKAKQDMRRLSVQVMELQKTDLDAFIRHLEEAAEVPFD